MPPQVVGTRSPRPAPDDLFAAILADAPVQDDAEDAPLPLEASGEEPDGDAALADLFDAAPTRPRPSPRAPTGTHWPAHNFGPAYDALQDRRPRRRGPPVLSESDVWDVDALHDDADARGTTGAVPEAATAAIPWSSRAAADDAWLAMLDGPASPRGTEARLLDVARGRPLQVTVLEVEETLRAKARAAARVPTRSDERPVWRFLGIGMALAAAVILLQLLMS